MGGPGSGRYCHEVIPNLPIVVFSDADSILRARSFTSAARALCLLAKERIPLVFCSGETRAELEAIQRELGIQHPFVCENGGAAFFPERYFGCDVPHARDVAGYEVVEFGRPHRDVMETLHRTADRLRIRIVGFSDMSVEQLARDCNLALLRAQRAKLREYEEPFRLIDDTPANRNRLIKALHAARLRCVTRGRYEHVGAPVDKGLGVSLLSRMYGRMSGRVLTVGLADATADENLLQLVDCPIVLQDSDPEPSAVDVAAWADAIVEGIQQVRRSYAAPVARALS
jgi:mannosyl-3-phosphoglycerate phosphatase